MTSPQHPLRHLPDPLVALFESPRMSEALTAAAIGTAAAAVAIRRLIGIPGLFAILTGLVVLMALSFVARRDEIELRGLLPLSLLGFLGWTAASVFWSGYQWASLGGIVYLGAYTVLGFYIALARDTIQILRAVGDVVRAMLGVSLALEVFSGILVDAPIPFLGIAGRIAELGPITGLAGTRNALGLIAVVGGITTVIEWRTRSTTRLTAALSAALSVATVLLTRSPVVYVVAVLAVLALGALYLLRRVRPERRPAAQLLTLGVVLVLLGIAWAIRGRLLQLVNGGGEADYRLDLWRQMLPFRELRELQGWGWLGRWDRALYPYGQFVSPAARPAGSASNAYLDLWFQVGLIGLALFVLAAGLAFVRSWLLAGRRRSIVYAWPAAVLVALLFTGLVESTLLYEFAWLVFVVCCVKASQELSWRSALDRANRASG